MQKNNLFCFIFSATVVVFMTTVVTGKRLSSSSNKIASSSRPLLLPYNSEIIQYDDEGNKMMFLPYKAETMTSVVLSQKRKKKNRKLTATTVPDNYYQADIPNNLYVENTDQYTQDENCNVLYPIGACLEDGGEIVCAVGPEACENSSIPYLPASSFNDQDFKCLLCRSNNEEESRRVQKATKAPTSTQNPALGNDYFLEYIKVGEEDDDDKCEIVFPVGACSVNGVLSCATGKNECSNNGVWFPPDDVVFTENNEFCYLCRPKDTSSSTIATTQSSEDYFLESINVGEEDDDECEIVFPVGACSVNGVLICATGKNDCSNDGVWLPPDDVVFTESNTFCYLCRSKDASSSTKVTAQPSAAPKDFFLESIKAGEDDENCEKVFPVGACINDNYDDDEVGRNIWTCATSKSECEDNNTWLADDAIEFKESGSYCFLCRAKDNTKPNSGNNGKPVVAPSTPLDDDDDDHYLIIHPTDDPEDCHMAEKVGGCKNIGSSNIVNCATHAKNCDLVSKYVEASQFRSSDPSCFKCMKMDDGNDSNDGLEAGFFLEQYPGKDPPPCCEMSMKVGGCKALHSGTIERCAFSPDTCRNDNVNLYVAASQFTTRDDPCWLCRGTKDGDDDDSDDTDDEYRDDDDTDDDGTTAQPPSPNNDDDSSDETNFMDKPSKEFFLEQYPSDKPPDCDHFMKVGGCRSKEGSKGIVRCALENENTCSAVNSDFIPASQFGPNEDPCFLCRNDANKTPTPSPILERNPTRPPTSAPTRPPTPAPVGQSGPATFVPYVQNDAVAPTPESAILPPPPSLASSAGENWVLMSGGNEIIEYDEEGGALMTTLIVILIVMACIIFGLAYMIRRRRFKRALAEATGVGLPDNLIGPSSMI